MTPRPAGEVSGITAIVPHWNRRDLLEPLLDRLRGQTCPVEEVLVVDNGSEDGSVELAKSKGARVIASPRSQMPATARVSPARALSLAAKHFRDPDARTRFRVTLPASKWNDDRISC